MNLWIGVSFLFIAMPNPVNGQRADGELRPSDEAFKSDSHGSPYGGCLWTGSDFAFLDLAALEAGPFLVGRGSCFQDFPAIGHHNGLVEWLGPLAPGVEENAHGWLR